MSTTLADPIVRLASALQDNEALRVRVRQLEERLEIAEEIISRLQSRSMEWEPQTSSTSELPHHLNHG